jgi:hypothetical protein
MDTLEYGTADSPLLDIEAKISVYYSRVMLWGDMNHEF